MSTKLHLRFAADMPPASVEVVTSDFQTVAQVWLGPGDSKEVKVPSSDVMVQVRMPSGDTVTLRDPGNTEREINRSALVGGYDPPSEAHSQVVTPSSLPKEHREDVESEWEVIGDDLSDDVIDKGDDMEEAGASEGSSRSSEAVTRSSGNLPPRRPSKTPSRLRLTAGSASALGELSVTLTSNNASERATVSADRRSLQFTPQAFGTYDFNLIVKAAANDPKRLIVRLPGSLAAVTVSLTNLGAHETLNIRAETRHAESDTLGSYLARGDLRAAASMTSWVEQAEQMLFYKGADPNAATVGAYLLLRLRRFDLMRKWARNLADRWPNLADGSVIWAWQLILQRGDTSEIGKYLVRAATCQRLPVYSEGLKLLLDGLRLLFGAGDSHSERLNERIGVLLWASPFTASLPQGALSDAPDLHIHVGYTTERLPVESSALNTVGYDADQQMLEIEFANGAVYRYFDVAEQAYRDLLDASSKGHYFSANIKAAGYKYRRLK